MNPRLIFEFCRTEEQCNGLEVASIICKVQGSSYFYEIVISDDWQNVVRDEEPFRILYIKHFLTTLRFATQLQLHALFTEGQELSTGPIRGRLLDPS